MRRPVPRKEKDNYSYPEIPLTDKEAKQDGLNFAAAWLVLSHPDLDACGAVLVMASLGLWDMEPALDYEELATEPATGPQDGTGAIPSAP